MPQRLIEWKQSIGWEIKEKDAPKCFSELEVHLLRLSRWKHMIFFFFSLRASGYIFISGDMMRLLPSHHAAVQRKELKIGIFYVFIHSHMCSSYDSIPGGFVLKSKNHLWLTDLPLKKHWEQYIRNMLTARRPWGHLQFHLIHAFILFNLSHPLLVQCCFFY